MRAKKYGRGWRAIRKAALKRADNICELGDSTPWGRCTVSERGRLHVHHVGHYVYLDIWPTLSLDDIDKLLGHAYELGQEKCDDELEAYLKRNPELYPVLCPRHHVMFEWHPYLLIYFVANNTLPTQGEKEEKDGTL